jgi:hypothetical protein
MVLAEYHDACTLAPDGILKIEAVHGLDEEP